MNRQTVHVPPPRIEGIAIKNFRALRDVKLSPLSPMTALLGPNGSGKSTVFDVFAFLRVNRVFKDKPGGLVVDYLGLANELKQALATYTESGGTGRTAINQEEAVKILLEKYEIC